jgi:hypothetical protein
MVQTKLGGPPHPPSDETVSSADNMDEYFRGPLRLAVIQSQTTQSFILRLERTVREGTQMNVTVVFN